MQLTISRKGLVALIGSIFGATFLAGRGDTALLRGAKDRDVDAFSNLMKLHAEPLRRFISRRVQERDIEDVYQETWVAAWESLPSFDSASRFRTWLFSICYHKIQDYWRREHMRPLTAQLMDFEGAIAYSPKEFDAVNLRESLRGFWEGCTSEQQELLRMYYSDGLTLKEISGVLAKNLNTVKYQFYRVHADAALKLPNSSDLIGKVPNEA
jgi:RNA polymerase sigma-70 factor (ECF subfamily)